MAITVQNVIDEAVTDIFIDDGGVDDFINPSVQGRAINWALDRVFEKCVEFNLNLYAFRERTLSLVAGTSEYALDADTLRVTAVFIRQGTSPSYNYTAVLPLTDAREHYDYQGFGSRVGYPNSVSSGFPFRWYESKQALDGSGNWVRYIKFTNIPDVSYTAVYDGLRNIVKVTVPTTTWSAPTTTYLDVPDSFKRSIVLEMVKYFNMKNKSRWDDINAELVDAYRTGMEIHRRGLQWQSPLEVVRSY